MSFLIVGRDPLVDEVVDALVDDEDLVRVVTDDAACAPRLKERGAFVAIGDPTDADLVERAGQGARTALVLDGVPVTPELLAAMSAARISRIIYGGRDKDASDLVSRSGLEFVILRRRRGLFRNRDRAVLVAAVVAADDLAGAPRLTVDLSDERAVSELLGR